MRRVAALAAAIAMAMRAASPAPFTGIWSGLIADRNTKGPDDTRIQLDFDRNLGGSQRGELYSITDVRVQGKAIRFNLRMHPELRFELTLQDNGHLTGKMTLASAPNDDRTSHPVDVTRSQPVPKKP